MKTIFTNTHNIVPLKNIREHLAAERTELALESTQLAWIRTVLTFMATGMAISKGVEALHNAKVISGKNLTIHANFAGIFLTIAGTVMLIVATFYFLLRRKQLAKIRGEFAFKMVPALLISICTILIGLGLSYLLITT
jgi:uncharacterized membrane protein YidH (DUF202 family)